MLQVLDGIAKWISIPLIIFAFLVIGSNLLNVPVENTEQIQQID